MVPPGDDPGRLQLTFSDARLVELDQAGDLVVHANRAERPGRPRAYQQVEGVRREVDVHFVMTLDGNIGFSLVRTTGRNR